MKFRFIMIWSLILATVFSISSYAQTTSINLFAEPKSDAKIVEKLQSDQGVIIIFQPKNSEWIKVANPQDGVVGWIKKENLGNTSLNYQVIQSVGSPGRYHVIRYGNMSEEQIQSMRSMFEQMEKRRLLMQKMMQENMDNMFKELQTFWQHEMWVPEGQPATKINANQNSVAKTPVAHQKNASEKK